MIACRIPTHHKEISQGASAPLMRTPSPFFAPPQPSTMREPGTNYLSILTDQGIVSTNSMGQAPDKIAR